jgi:hypothetical protein
MPDLPAPPLASFAPVYDSTSAGLLKGRRPCAPPLASDDPVYGRPDAAAYLQISPAFLKKLDLEGRGPTAIRIGRRWLYRRSDLEAFLDRHRCAPAPAKVEEVAA